MATLFNKLEALDMDWTLAINSHHAAWSDGFWLFMSDVQVWYVLYILVAAAFIWRLGWKKGVIMIAATALCVVASDQLCNLVKDAAERLRPCNDPRMVARGLHILQKPGLKHPYGFWSAHAANAAVFAFCSAKAFRMDLVHGKTRTYARVYPVIITLWAPLVGASRVFVGKHFVGDVLTGFAAGTVVAALICGLCCRILLPRAANRRVR